MVTRRSWWRQLRRQYVWRVRLGQPAGDLSGVWEPFEMIGLQQRQVWHLVLYYVHRRSPSATNRNPVPEYNQVAISGVAAIARAPAARQRHDRRFGRLDRTFRPHHRHQLLLATNAPRPLDQLPQTGYRAHGYREHRLCGFNPKEANRCRESGGMAKQNILPPLTRTAPLKDAMSVIGAVIGREFRRR